MFFFNDKNLKYNLNEFNFGDIWLNKFSDYRALITKDGIIDCADCDKLDDCRGKCPFFDELFLCELIS